MTAGRPCKLTPNMHENIVNAIISGASDSMVADLVGLDSSTIFKWCVRGKEDIADGLDTKYSSFFIDYKKEKAVRDIKLVQFVEIEASINWTAAMRLLEARRAKEFGRSAAYREPFEVNVESRSDFIAQILKMVADNHISADEGVKFAKIMLDNKNTEHKTTLLDRLENLEIE